MIVLPAIDLKDHQVVRLRKGEFDTVHRVAEDPLQTARAFAAAGAKYIHMVDLDGARSGARKNEAEVRAVAEHSGLKVELGGGLRTLADLEAADAMGVTRMVIGSAAVSDPDFVRAPWSGTESASPWALTPGTAWSKPPAGRTPPGWTTWTSPSPWNGLA